MMAPQWRPVESSRITHEAYDQARGILKKCVNSQAV